jgi:four helix bundle protein
MRKSARSRSGALRSEAEAERKRLPPEHGSLSDQVSARTDEIYGLTSQLRRSAVSVPSNLAEGHGRTSRPDFHRFIAQARGSLLEVETQLEIARNLGYLSQSAAATLLSEASEVGRIINGLRSWSEKDIAR